MSVKSHLTYGASVRPEITKWATKVKKIGGLPETTVFKSYATKLE